MAKMNLAIFLFLIVGYLVWPLLFALFGGEDVLLGFPMPIRRFALTEGGASLAEPFNVVNIAIDFCFWYLVGIGYLWYKQNKELENE